MNKKITLSAILVVIVFFSFSTVGDSLGPALVSVYALTDNINQTQILDLLSSNLTQARDAISEQNSTEATAQLTSIIGELSDIIAKITTDKGGQYHDEHTHIFTHKDDTHTVTHRHPHHHDHHQDWFERHQIFNPSHCPPGRLC